MRIGELSKRSGFSRDAIRLYERSGLIRSDSRETENNYKNYPESSVYTLEVIRDAQAAGMTIDDLSLLLKQLETGDPDEFDGDEFLTKKIEEIEIRVGAATRFLETLKQTRDALTMAPFGKN